MPKGLIEISSSLANFKAPAIKSSQLTRMDIFSLTDQDNQRKATPLHRAVTTGNYVGLKILLESSVLFGSFSEKKNSFVKGLNRDLKEALCIDVFA